MVRLPVAVRSLGRTPGFAANIVAVLALGIGASVAVFSVIDSVMLRPLPWPEPDRLVQLMVSTPLGRASLASVPQLNFWREYTRAFDGIAAFEPTASTSGAIHVSADYFLVFGVRPIIGRTFLPEDDRPGGVKVAIISDEVWRNRFNATPSLAGRTIQIDDAFHEVIGVMPAAFVPEPRADIWLPLQAPKISFDHSSRLRVVARLSRGITITMAEHQMWFAAGQFNQVFPHVLGPKDHFTAKPLRDVMIGDIRPALFVLSGAVLFLLLIACGNAACLLLARAARRTSDIATRAALGAGRRRLIVQLLTESAVLSLCAAIFGLVLGTYGIRLLVALYPGSIPAVTIDLRVLAFALLTAVSTTLLAGAIPAWLTSQVDLASAFRENSAQSGTSARQGRIRSVLVGAELTVAVVLLVCAGLLIRTFVSMHERQRGFDAQNVLTIAMPLSGTRYESVANKSQLVRDTVRRLAKVPNVTAAATTSSLPLDPGLFSLPFTVLGREQMKSPYHGSAQWRSVSPDYFRVLGTALTRGRTFTDEDDADSEPVAIVNRTMARRYWQGASPIGARVSLGQGLPPEFNEPVRKIVGIVDDVQDVGLRREAEPMIYVPDGQVSDAMNGHLMRSIPLTWVVRTQQPESTRGAIRDAIVAASGGLGVLRVRPMDEVLAESTARARFHTVLLSVFAAIALVLASSGIYGMMAYSVEQRKREIGIRMAVGASPEAVRGLVLGSAGRAVMPGLSIGIACAVAVARYMDSVIFGLAIEHIGVIMPVLGLLLGVSLVAAWVPARRATLVDPVKSLQ